MAARRHNVTQPRSEQTPMTEKVPADDLWDPLMLSIDSDAASAEGEAYRYILHRIRLGELEPGARVRTEDVASAMGVSRQPVREAIRRLEAEGYLTSRPNRGAIVSKHTPGQLLELFEIRAALEGLAARIVASQFELKGFDVLEQQLSSMEAAGSEANAWLGTHGAFHLQLATLARRPRLLHEIARLHASLEPYLRLWYIHTGTPANARQDHEQLLQALRSGYPGHAEEVMRDHVLETAPQIIAHLEATGQATIATDLDP
jgi:DNA-binding GntR family transcriptional regulator